MLFKKHMLCVSILMTSLCCAYSYYPKFIVIEAEAQSGKILSDSKTLVVVHLATCLQFFLMFRNHTRVRV